MMQAETPQLGAWIASGSLAAVEIAAAQGVDFFVIDAEHGEVDDRGLNAIIPIIHGFDVSVLVKVRAPEREAIQRPLDFGADGIIIPHIKDLAQAKRITSFAKYPPLGDRSLAAERALRYASLTPEWIEEQDLRTKCYPMIESAESLEDIEAIAALPTVDGVCIGPSDLAIRRGRGCYSVSDEDLADFDRIAAACESAGKDWIMPAWAPREQEYCIRRGATGIIVANEYTALGRGFGSLVTEARDRVAE